MPRALDYLTMVTLDTDQVVIGSYKELTTEEGRKFNEMYSALYRLYCSACNDATNFLECCRWEDYKDKEITKNLIAREDFVAMTIPDEFCVSV